MGKTLIIVEAPSKATHIQQFLGTKDYIVKASVGHVRELPIPSNMTDKEKSYYGDMAQKLDNDFEPLYKVSKDKTKIVSDLKKALAGCDELVLATDNDAEGQAISWHLLQVLKPTVPTYRATWNEITDKAVRAGLASKKLIDSKKQEPKEFFQNAESALARGQWDRIFGYATSPVVWKTVKTGGSAGRVQTPGTRLVVEREEKRLAFKSVAFYTIWGEFDGTKAKLVNYNKEKIADSSKIDDEGNIKEGHLLITDENIDEILKNLKSKDYIIGDIKSKPYKRNPPAPFTTSTALQSIGSKTRMSAKQLTRTMQELYASDAAVTYIRTVSVVASPDAIAEARKEIAATFGKHYVPATANVYTDKKAGNSGHECIRNVLDDKTGKLVKKSFSDKKKQEVFDLIRMRFMASQSIPCTGTTWTALFSAKDNNAVFSASETEIHEPGWTTIYEIDEEVGA